MPRRVDMGEAVVEFAEFLWQGTGDVALRELERLMELAKAEGFDFRTARELAEA